MPFILLTFLMAFVVQEMTVRLGVATHRGHAELIFQRFGPFWGYFAMADLVFGNLLTLVTEFIAIQAGGLYFGVPAWLSVAIGVALVFASLALRRYATWERALMALAAGNLLFIPAALFAHPERRGAGPRGRDLGPLPGGFNTAFVTLILANIGATVTPWMIFFQQSAVVDKGLTRARSAARPDRHRDRRRRGRGRRDRHRGRDRAAVRRTMSTSRNFASGADFATGAAALPRHHRRHAVRARHHRGRAGSRR